MHRFRGYELEDQPWFPSRIRQGMTDYLQFIFRYLNLYKPVVPLLKEGLVYCKTQQMIDLCSGSGGAIERINQELIRDFISLHTTLTDKYPNFSLIQYFNQQGSKTISYYCNSVDAALVPAHLIGFRTIFSGFHHFNEDQAVAVIKNTVAANEGIAIFDGGDKNLIIILIIIIFHPIAIFLVTPFIKPFRWWRVVFTYLIPLIPLGAIWDGIFSILSLYSPDELLKIANKADKDKYFWKAGKLKNQFGMHISYLIGLPRITDIVLVNRVQNSVKV